MKLSHLDVRLSKEFVAFFISISMGLRVYGVALPCRTVQSCMLCLSHSVLPAGFERLPRFAWFAWQEGTSCKYTAKNEIKLESTFDYPIRLSYL